MVRSSIRVGKSSRLKRRAKVCWMNARTQFRVTVTRRPAAVSRHTSKSQPTRWGESEKCLYILSNEARRIESSGSRPLPVREGDRTATTKTQGRTGSNAWRQPSWCYFARVFGLDGESRGLCRDVFPASRDSIVWWIYGQKRTVQYDVVPSNERLVIASESRVSWLKIVSANG